MPEYLIRSGTFTAIVVAENRVTAIEQAIRLRSSDSGEPVQMGDVTQVINLDECEAATWYTKTQGVLELLKFEENPCGVSVEPTNPLSLN